MYQSKTTIKIGKDVFEIGFPNVGQQLEIESRKNMLTNGRYDEIAGSRSNTANFLLDYVDAVAYFGVMVPELKETCSVKNFERMDPLIQRRLGRAFVKYHSDFLLPVQQEINRILDKDELDQEEQETPLV